jgi:hypothetical protein
MKVLFLTDSLSLPRIFKDGKVRWENTYVSLLKNARPDLDFVHVGLGGATITELYRQLKYYSAVTPDITILHCGIVDCAPRALGQLEQQILIKLKLITLVKPLTAFLRRVRNISYTSPRRFENTLVAIKETFKDKPLVAIGILPGCPEYEAVVPGISKRILAYNEILKKHCIYIDNSDFPREGIIDDFHHMNETGHTRIYETLSDFLRNKV